MGTVPLGRIIGRLLCGSETVVALGKRISMGSSADTMSPDIDEYCVLARFYSEKTERYFGSGQSQLAEMSRMRSDLIHEVPLEVSSSNAFLQSSTGFIASGAVASSPLPLFAPHIKSSVHFHPLSVYLFSNPCVSRTQVYSGALPAQSRII